MVVTGSNPCQQDDVAAALAADGIDVYARYGSTLSNIRIILIRLSHGPNIIIDDGGDLIQSLHTRCQHLTRCLWRLRSIHNRHFTP